jgi:hypothetical protein
MGWDVSSLTWWARVAVHHLSLWCAGTLATAPARSPRPACYGAAPPPGTIQLPCLAPRPMRPPCSNRSPRSSHRRCRQLEDFSALEGKPAVTSLRPPCLAGHRREFFSKIILKKSGLRDGVRCGVSPPPDDGTPQKKFQTKNPPGDCPSWDDLSIS